MVLDATLDNTDIIPWKIFLWPVMLYNTQSFSMLRQKNMHFKSLPDLGSTHFAKYLKKNKYIWNIKKIMDPERNARCSHQGAPAWNHGCVLIPPEVISKPSEEEGVKDHTF